MRRLRLMMQRLNEYFRSSRAMIDIEAGQKVRILAVDDDPHEARLIQALLERTIPVEVESVPDCVSARTRLSTNFFDLVLLDYILQEETGFSLLADISGKPEGPPVLVMTAYGNEHIAAKSIQLGAAGYVVKDFTLPTTLPEVIMDVLEKVREREMESSRARESALSEIADHTGEVILRLDEEWKITFMNDEACEFLGKEREELLGRNIIDFVHPDDTEGLYNTTKLSALTGDVVIGLIVRIWTPLGWKSVEWNAVPILDECGEHSGFQVTGRDVTEKRRTEELIMRVNEELDAYAHTVSHDLRGPLSAVMLAADTLKLLIEDRLTEQAAETVNELAQIISENTERAGALIGDLLMLAESGQLPGETEDVVVADIVRMTVEEMGPQIALKGIDVLVDKDLGVIHANRTQVYQVFANLLRNAIKYNDRPQPDIEVRYLGALERSHRYLIRDNGSGIPPEQLEHIFTPFFSGEGSGTGVGLAIVKKIVEIYGGDIRAFNDEGACFEFTLRDT